MTVISMTANLINFNVHHTQSVILWCGNEILCNYDLDLQDKEVVREQWKTIINYLIFSAFS